MKRRVSFVMTVMGICVALCAALLAQGDSVQKFLDGKALLGVYNGVVVDYLLNEGKGKLSAAQQKQALDQLVAGLREKAQVSKNEQLGTALGNLVGVLMGVAGGDVIGEAGAEVQGAYAGEWASWVDAADKLAEAGYTDDAVSFYRFGMVQIPYGSLRGRCVMGLARAKPDDAYAVLMDALKKPDDNLRNEALRMLGYMASAEGVPAERKDAIIATLIDYSKGITHSLNYRAAIFGLDKANDPRAVPALSRFRKGLAVDELDRRAALRSLLLTYKDETVVEDLTKKLKTGMMSTNKPADRLYAGVVLMEGGRQEGFDWAVAELKPKKGGFLKTKEDVDLRPNLVQHVVRVGGDRAVKVLATSVGAYKDDEWLKTWMAIGLLELGDTSQVALAKAALGRPGWDFTAVRIATALAKNGDTSGIAALKALCEKTTPESVPEQLLAIVGGQDPAAEKGRLEFVRRQAAQALGEINHADGVPVLARLLQDKSFDVRMSAAYALAEMTTAAVVPTLKLALETDYGVVSQTPRNPGIWAHVLRTAVTRFPKEAGTKDVLGAADKSSDAGVRFVALLARE